MSAGFKLGAACWVIGAAALSAGTARAQDVDGPEASVGPDVVVTGTRAALESAEHIKRDSDVLVDGISADDIGALPDISIADSLVRIPGVTANDTQDGNGFDQVSIRGLGPDLTSASFNGRTLPTNSGSDRRVSLGSLPTEGIGAAYAQKTPDAATIEGGLAGNLDIQSVHPLETRRHGLTVVVRGTDDDIVNKVDGPYGFKPLGFRGELSYVGRLADNLGLALSYSYFEQTNVSPTTQFDTYRTGTGARGDLDHDGKPDAYPANAGIRVGANNDSRHAIIGMVQWDPVSSLRISADGFYIHERDNDRTTRLYATGLAGGSVAVPTTSTVIDDTVVAMQGQAGNYTLLANDGNDVERQYEGGFNVAFDDGGPVTFKVDLSYARASVNGGTHQATIQNDAASSAAQRIAFGYNFTNAYNVQLNFNPLTAQDYALSQIDSNNPFRSDTTKAARFDFNVDTGKGFLDSIDFGMRVDNRIKLNVPNDSSYSFSDYTTRPDLDDSYLDWPTNPLANIASRLGGMSAVSYPLFSYDKLATLINAPGGVYNDEVKNDIAGRARVGETTYALYSQLNLKRGPLTGNIGARYLLTDETVEGFLGTTEVNKVAQRVKHSYHYLLPSLNLRYDLTRTMDARFALSKTMSRPVYGNLKIGSAFDLSTASEENIPTLNRGNPDLKPFTSNNVDLSFEWYPNRHMTLAVQGFYKEVTNFVIDQQTATTLALDDGTLVPVLINSSANDPAKRHFEGVEVIARRELNFLPGFLSNLGIRADYSHNWTDVRDQIGSVQILQDAANNIPAQSETVSLTPTHFTADLVNAQLYYSTKRVDLRLAYRWYSQYNIPARSAYQSHPGGQFDLSGSYAIRRNVRVIGTIRNLTQTKDIQYIRDWRDLDNDKVFRTILYHGREFTLGVRANF